MYELIVLSLLSRYAMHGYKMAKIINDIIGPYARISHGRLYPLLAKLEADGLIAREPEDTPAGAGERGQHRYTITESGRERFHQLMMDTTSNPGDYDRIFWLKATKLMLDLLTPSERLYLVDHYLTYCQAHIFHLTSEAESLRRDVARLAFMSPAELDATLFMMRHRMREWQLALDDARALRSRLLAQAEGLTDPDAAAFGERRAPDQHAEPRGAQDGS